MSLRPNDLEGLVKSQISIDEYKSKMGEDRSVVVVGIPVREESAAHDLGDFIERGPFDLWDVDVSPAPDADGMYFVFIELARSHSMWGTIHNIFEHIERITSNSVDAITFTCPDHDRPEQLSEDNFKGCVLQSPYRWDIAHGEYPEVPDMDIEQDLDQNDPVGRIKFLTDY